MSYNLYNIGYILKLRLSYNRKLVIKRSPVNTVYSGHQYRYTLAACIWNMGYTEVIRELCLKFNMPINNFYLGKI